MTLEDLNSETPRPPHTVLHMSTNTRRGLTANTTLEQRVVHDHAAQQRKTIVSYCSIASLDNEESTESAMSDSGLCATWNDDSKHK